MNTSSTACGLASRLPLLALLALMLTLTGCEAGKQVRLAQAANLAGNPSAAERHYRLALAANPKLAEDPQFAAALRRAQAQSLHEDARRLAAQNNWDKAMDQYRAAITVDPEYQPPREDLADAPAKAAAWHIAQAADLEGKNRLDEAINHLQQAVQFHPTHASASRELDRLLTVRRERREKAESLLIDSRRLAAEKQWDPAIAAALSAAKLVPSEKAYPEQADAVRLAAANDWINQGENRLDQNQLEQAESAFTAALRYAANHKSALRGLGDADLKRGQAAQQQGLLGQAFLHFRRAAAHLQDPRYTQAVAVAREQIIRAHTIDVKVRGKADDAELVTRVLADFQKRRPAWVRLIDADHANPGSYVFDVDLVRIDINEKLTATRQAAYKYDVQEDIPNPRLPELRRALHDAERERDRLIRRRDEECSRCDGRGWVRCDDCEKNRRKCDACDGRGKRHNVSHHDVQRLENEVTSLRHQLAQEPTLVKRITPRQWAFTLHDYTKTGDLETIIHLADAVRGEMVESQTVRRHFAADDTANSGANPDIGLAVDPLTLPPDIQVQRDLITGAAGEVAQRLTLMIARQRHAALEAVASKTNPPESLELRVAAALMLEPAEPQRAEQLLNQLP